MIIERGSEERYKEALEVIKNFYEESLHEYDTRLDEKKLIDSFDKYKYGSFLLIINGKCEGILAGVGVTSPLNNDMIYQEMIWYVNKPYRKYGVYLLNKAQEILKQEGYKAIIMVCLYNSMTDKLIKLYEKMGFKMFESHFIRNL
jgi:GNAT superfamily N-acetyltransferase